MFSARSGKELYIAGRVPNPKSREYTCPICDEKVVHVRASKHSMTIPVSEHFRHMPGSSVSHPHRIATWQRRNVMGALIDNFSSSPIFDFETDKRYTAAGGLDFVVDMLVKERTSEGDIETAILVESGEFNANDFLTQWKLLTTSGVNLLTILSAHGKKNPKARYFRPEKRWRTGETVRKIEGNELALYNKQGRNVYFDHEKMQLKLIRFEDYSEYQDEIVAPNGFVVPAGTKYFKTKKTPASTYIINLENETFGLRYRRTSGGLLIARPVSFNDKNYLADLWTKAKELGSIDLMFDVEGNASRLGLKDLKYDVAERIGIALDSMSEERLRNLSAKYGEDKLGAYYVEQ